MENNLLKKLPYKIKSRLNLIGRLADNSGIRAYVAGGVVRDILLKKDNLDLDIAVEADAIDFTKRLEELIPGKLVKHQKFGTATLFEKGFRIDLATARKETYSQPGALPNVCPGTIREDLFRRDFTINAMAISINSATFGELYDFFGGLNDLKKKKIRILHDLSFVEDPTRILRAIRFKERLGFSLEEKTASLMRQALKVRMLLRVSDERIFNELVHILKEDKIHKQILAVSNICGFKFIDPRIKIDSNAIKLLKKAGKEVRWFETVFTKKRKPDAWLSYFIILLNNINDVATIHKIIKRFNLKKQDSKRILSYNDVKNKIKNLNKNNLSLSAIFRILKPLSYEEILLVKINSSSKIVKKRIITFLKIDDVKLKVKGEDLKKIGLSPGKDFGLLLEKALYRKIEGKLKTKSQELDFIRRIAR